MSGKQQAKAPSRGDATLSKKGKAGGACLTCGVDCVPNWFTEKTTFRGVEYSAAELNDLARTVYGEASGSVAGALAGYSPAEITKERQTVAGVIFNRGTANPTMTVSQIINKDGQFMAVSNPDENGKFLNADPAKAKALTPAECADLNAAIDAVKAVLKSGICSGYGSFRSAASTTRGTRIGGTRFF